MLLLSALIAFFVLLGITAILAISRGDRYDRAGAVVMVLAGLLSFYADKLLPGFLMPNDPVFLIDVALLIALVAITARSTRYWPIWAAGFQIVTVLTHIATFIQPHVVPTAYALAIGIWAFPTVGALTTSLLLRNRRFARDGI